MFDILLKIQINGKEFSTSTGEWINKIVDIQTRLLDDVYSDFTEDLAEEGKKIIERNLFTGKLWNGEPAAPLSDGWLRKKGHSKLFFYTGELYRSILTQKLPNGAEIFIADGRAQIASWLINGTGKMPARDFFGLQPERVDVLIKTLLEERFSMYGRAA